MTPTPTPIPNEIPYHLRQFIARQEYEQYTAIDHASWRYIMRVSCDFFREHAHAKYLEGLKETGITIERIPRISEMDEKLKRFGWRAVAVTGFIPPAAFLELQSLRILPIASDMRKLENIDYTPAPDIVHEAAGHAPIIADPAYASYLGKFGEIARYVIFAKEDLEVYEAVLNLSEIKEDPHATPEQLESARERLRGAEAMVPYVSEAQQLTRLGWWTTEYGLFKDGERFLIYGAGLLSSLGESYDCLSESVPKIPLSIECIETDYDITRPQPQLFYTDDFKKLEDVIDELAARMAYKRGGIEGLGKARRARTVTTARLDSGLEISGVLTDFRARQADARENVDFLRYEGPVQLSVGQSQISGHGASYHAQGFSSPIGRIKGMEKPASEMSGEDFARLGFDSRRRARLEFESGIVLEGVLTSMHREAGRTLIVSFDDCSIRQGDEVLYQPEWGPFDMACGERVVSVFGGAADRSAYLHETGVVGKGPRPQKRNLTEENKDLAELYARARACREGAPPSRPAASRLAELTDIARCLSERYPNDWLLRLELLELLEQTFPAGSSLADSLRRDLERISQQSEKYRTLIARGLALLPHH